MNYKGAWGSTQAFFVPKTGQKEVILGGILSPPPHTLSLIACSGLSGAGTNCTLPICINRLLLFHILRFAFCEMRKIVYLCEK